MTLKRRQFLRTMGAGTVAAGIGLPVPELMPQGTPRHVQEIHRDYITNGAGVEYFLLGNGLIQAAVQLSPTDAATQCGLLVMSPEHFGRKVSTFLFHPEHGLQRTRLTVTVNTTGYQPGTDARVAWAYPDGIPTVTATWAAGPCSVTEEYLCPSGTPALIRRVTVRNTAAAAASVKLLLAMSPNFMFFDEYDVDRQNKTLTAIGYHRLQLFSPQASAVGDRHLEAAFGPLPPGTARTATFVLTLDHPREEFERAGEEQLRGATAAYWARTASLESHHAGLDHIFACARTGIRAAVARSGKMDGGIWQYNQEWVRDQSMVATAASMLGMYDVASAIFTRILTRSVDETGKTVESSRTRPPETFELDQNGELLYGLHAHWMWSGSDALIREHWTKIRAVAEYLLQPMFMDPATGMLKNTREYWERDQGFGIREGFELTYQLFSFIGLELAAEMALGAGDGVRGSAWRQAATRMKESFLHHPRYALVENDRFIKRRLATGEVQRTIEPPNRKAMPPGMPLQVEKVCSLDPDSSSVLPIAFEAVDPRSSLSLNTLRSMEEIWNQRWDGGGYGRYNLTSEPDSPGPWPFASMFIARAALEAGDHAKAWRVLDWLTRVQGGRGGAWFEMYGDRPVPPLPPVGIVPWNWAEMAMFVVHHVLGVRPAVDRLTIRPLLLDGLTAVDARVILHGAPLTLHLKKGAGTQKALVAGKEVPLRDGRIEVPLPPSGSEITIML